jgi:hypothetical protein
VQLYPNGKKREVLTARSAQDINDTRSNLDKISEVLVGQTKANYREDYLRDKLHFLGT